MHILFIDYHLSVTIGKLGFTVGPWYLSLDYDNDVWMQLIAPPAWRKHPQCDFNLDYKVW
jgi:hypothetical protein